MTDTASTPTTPGAPQPVPSATPGAPVDVQAAIDAAVAAALAGVPAAVDAAVAEALATAEGATVSPTGVVTEPVTVQLTPIEELFVILNIAPTPNQVANVTEWLGRQTPAAASPQAAGAPAAGTATPAAG